MEDQSEALAFLADGASHGRKGAVERIDTHASAIFLYGERALKLKRAVRFAYLDYGTVAAREAACRAEVELNRRTAPKLYLGVRAIRRRGDGKLGWDGAGEAVDWVVEMRRFPAGALFDRMAEARRLTPALMRATADAIAAFHAAAEPSHEFGGKAGLLRVIEGNRDSLAACAALDRESAGRVEAAQQALVETLASLLERRRRGDKVRRCHGDLHLGNICLIDGRPTLFDAIEFSAAIGTIDVLYDLAFLVMDLLERKLAGLANLVLNRYLDLARDDAGLAALPLFLSLRATIRAHVTATAAERQRNAAQRRKQEARSQSYLALAETLVAPAAPRLIAIGGFSGSGKSTLARAIASELAPAPGARVLRSDVLRKALLDLPPETRLPASAYSPAMSRHIYAALHNAAARALAAGMNVILDATYQDEREREAARQLAENAGLPFTGIWLETRREVMAGRLAERRGDASDATVAVLDQQLRTGPGALAWARLDSSGALVRTLAALRRAAGLA